MLSRFPTVAKATVLVLALLALCLVYPVPVNAVSPQWTMILDQTTTDYSLPAYYPKQIYSNNKFQVTKDLLGLAVGSLGIPDRQSVADDFEILPNTSCARLLVALESLRGFSDNGYGEGQGDNCSGRATQCTFNRTRNPDSIQLAISQHNVTSNSPNNIPLARFILKNPVGNWSNMTNSLKTDIAGYHTAPQSLDWFDLDLSNINNRTGLNPGKYWLIVIQADIEMRTVYFPQTVTAFTNDYTIAIVTDSTGYMVNYGLPAIQPGVGDSFGSDANGWIPYTCADTINVGIKCGMAMQLVGYCSTTNPSVTPLNVPMPPPVCTWSQGQPWKCPPDAPAVPSPVSSAPKVVIAQGGAPTVVITQGESPAQDSAMTPTVYSDASEPCVRSMICAFVAGCFFALVMSM